MTLNHSLDSIIAKTMVNRKKCYILIKDTEEKDSDSFHIYLESREKVKNYCKYLLEEGANLEEYLIVPPYVVKDPDDYL